LLFAAQQSAPATAAMVAAAFDRRARHRSCLNSLLPRYLRTPGRLGASGRPPPRRSAFQRGRDCSGNRGESVVRWRRARVPTSARKLPCARVDAGASGLPCRKRAPQPTSGHSRA